MMPTKFSKEKAGSILLDYKSGMLLKHLAFKYNSTVTSIGMWLSRQNACNRRVRARKRFPDLFKGILGFGS